MKCVLLITLIFSILESGWSMTEWMKVRAELDQIQVLAGRMENQTREMEFLGAEIEILRAENQELRSALEMQMTEVQEEVREVQNDVTILETQKTEVQEVQDEVIVLENHVSNMLSQQVIQDEKIHRLEQNTEDLDSRVETQEGEIRELEARLTVAERNQEETTIAFRAVMTRSDDDNIPVGSTVKFSNVKLNQGNGYNPNTGVFTVPSGGEGYYYVANYITAAKTHRTIIDIRVNGDTVCSMHVNTESTEVGSSNGGCSAVLLLEEGDAVSNVYRAGTDSAPVFEGRRGLYNGFTGFRI